MRRSWFGYTVLAVLPLFLAHGYLFCPCSEASAVQTEMTAAAVPAGHASCAQEPECDKDNCKFSSLQTPALSGTGAVAAHFVNKNLYALTQISSWPQPVMGDSYFNKVHETPPKVSRSPLYVQYSCLLI